MRVKVVAKDTVTSSCSEGENWNGLLYLEKLSETSNTFETILTAWELVLSEMLTLEIVVRTYLVLIWFVASFRWLGSCCSVQLFTILWCSKFSSSKCGEHYFCLLSEKGNITFQYVLLLFRPEVSLSAVIVIWTDGKSGFIPASSVKGEQCFYSSEVVQN